MKTSSKNVTKTPFAIKLDLPFPPEVSPIRLIEKAVIKLNESGQTSRIPNAFIAYRMEYCKELKKTDHPVITQPILSSMAKESWDKEPERIRKKYQLIAAEAKELYRQICREKISFNIDAKKEKSKAEGDEYDQNSYLVGNSFNDPLAFNFQIPPECSLDGMNRSNVTRTTSTGLSLPSPYPTHQSRYEFLNEIPTIDFFETSQNISSTSTPPNHNEQSFDGLSFTDDSQYFSNQFLDPTSKRSEIISNSAVTASTSNYSLPYGFPSYATTTTTTTTNQNHTSFPILSFEKNKQSSEDCKCCNCCKEKVETLKGQMSQLEKKLEALSNLVNNNLAS
ncbi:hypothetical protein G9A89_017811 [Geosiphon pyriformis]|nr:hypothetical protein G9A89_017811 [Geosiphon pyriformis]